MQRKVVNPNDFTTLHQIAERLDAFENRYTERAMPFGRTFGRDDLPMPLRRPTHKRNAELWGFAIHLTSRAAYQSSILPNGQLTGTPKQALDCARSLCLNDPTTWT